MDFKWDNGLPNAVNKGRAFGYFKDNELMVILTQRFSTSRMPSWYVGNMITCPSLKGYREAAKITSKLLDLAVEDAEKYGLVSLCVEDDELEAKSLEIATRLANGAPSAIRWTKYALNHYWKTDPKRDINLPPDHLRHSTTCNNKIFHNKYHSNISPSDSQLTSNRAISQ